MRFLAALGALCFLASASLATAQIQVSAQTERNNFLLYERVDLHVKITNLGENNITLNNDEGHPWLSFMVSKHNNLPVHPERQATFKPLELKAGETKTLKVDITPLFSFREEGQYSAAAVINLPGQGDMLSGTVPFTVMRGRTVWTEKRVVEGHERIYSLIRFSPTPDRTNLYLRVEIPEANTIMTNLSLGEVVAFVDPEVFFDPQGNIHVMQPIALSTYLYSRANSDGKVIHQDIFKTFQQVAPHLAKLDDGNVIVRGGLEENPNTPRETLSQGRHKAAQADQTQPMPPPIALPASSSPAPDRIPAPTASSPAAPVGSP